MSTLPPPSPIGHRSVEVQGRSTATVESLWSLVGEAHRWKEWSFLTRSDLARDGDPAPDGVGAIRRFTSHGVGSHEEVVAWEPPHHLAYVILRGFPVRHHRADVLLEPAEGGSAITWSATFDEKIPGTGPLMEAVMRRLLGRFVAGVTSYADREAEPVGHGSEPSPDQPINRRARRST